MVNNLIWAGNQLLKLFYKLCAPCLSRMWCLIIPFVSSTYLIHIISQGKQKYTRIYHTIQLKVWSLNNKQFAFCSIQRQNFKKRSGMNTKTLSKNNMPGTDIFIHY